MQFAVQLRDGSSFVIDAAYIEVVSGPQSSYTFLGPVPGYPTAILATFPVELVAGVYPRQQPGGRPRADEPAVEPARDQSGAGESPSVQAAGTPFGPSPSGNDRAAAPTAVAPRSFDGLAPAADPVNATSGQPGAVADPVDVEAERPPAEQPEPPPRPPLPPIAAADV